MSIFTMVTRSAALIIMSRSMGICESVCFVISEWQSTAMPTARANNRAPLGGTVPSGGILNDGTVPSGLHFNLFLFV